MRICDNGVYRDTTPEEESAWENTPEPGSEDEELDDTELVNILLGEGLEL